MSLQISNPWIKQKIRGKWINAKCIKACYFHHLAYNIGRHFTVLISFSIPPIQKRRTASQKCHFTSTEFFWQSFQLQFWFKLVLYTSLSFLTVLKNSNLCFFVFNDKIYECSVQFLSKNLVSLFFILFNTFILCPLISS